MEAAVWTLIAMFGATILGQFQLMYSLRRELSRVAERLTALEARVGNLEARFDQFEARFDQLEARFDPIDDWRGEVDTWRQALTQRVSQIEG